MGFDFYKTCGKNAEENNKEKTDSVNEYKVKIALKDFLQKMGMACGLLIYSPKPINLTQY